MRQVTLITITTCNQSTNPETEMILYYVHAEWCAVTLCYQSTGLSQGDVNRRARHQQRMRIFLPQRLGLLVLWLLQGESVSPRQVNNSSAIPESPLSVTALDTLHPNPIVIVPAGQTSIVQGSSHQEPSSLKVEDWQDAHYLK
jgi:hypothetical protein